MSAGVRMILPPSFSLIVISPIWVIGGTPEQALLYGYGWLYNDG